MELVDISSSLTSMPLKMEGNNADDEVATARDDLLSRLLDSSLDLLSLSSEQSIKGLRDGVKKVWSAVTQSVGDGFNIELIEAIIVAVVGDDGGESR